MGPTRAPTGRAATPAARRGAGRTANLALLGLVPLALVTGLAMFLLGTGPVWVVAIAHGAVALAILALVPWKAVVVRRGLARPARRGRSTSVALTWVVLAALLSGVAHVVGATLSGLAVTTMQLHVTAGVLATVVTVAHARERPVRPRREDLLSRRAVLRLGAAAVVAGAMTAVVQGAGMVLAAPGLRRATGSWRLASSSVEAIPVTSWLFDTVPLVEASSWRVTVASDGVERQVSVAELTAHGDRLTAVLDCTGGWWSEQEWSGALLGRLLPGVADGAAVLVTSVTGYSRRVPLGGDVLLATAVGGQALSDGHGAPVRLVVPGRRGYHWVKWVARVEVEPGVWWAQPPLPLR